MTKPKRTKKNPELTPQADDWDWEVVGDEEMNDLHRELSKEARVLGVRDTISAVKDIISLCSESLCKSELMGIKDIVSNTLHFVVYEQLNHMDQELRAL